ncbi:MAG: M18 family aminopeptidase [Lachnospiraceae bacterium]|nr:M18 family aminopeptidase [Lachnospiraceae bacterium]
MELFDFIKSSPNAYFAVDTMAKELKTAGFTRLDEKDSWKIKPGKYFVTRDDSSLIAFVIPKKDFKGFHIVASHSDSPSFKIKPDPEMKAGDAYIKLNVEKYGGMIISTWFDRPLSVAGRVVVDAKDGVQTKLVNIDRDLFIIPSLAIHMDRTANEGHKYEVQKELLPLFAGGEKKDAKLISLICKECGIKEKDVLDADLFLYNRMAPVSFGMNNEFIASPRLDDLQCVYGSLEGILAAKPSDYVAVHAVFNNEEVGSETKQGAASSFLTDVIARICEKLSVSVEDRARKMADSFMISADNAHALHPNYSEKTDPTNKPVLNGGIVIKYNANQKYTTDAVSSAFLRKICKKTGAKVQEYVNPSDIPGGSTLGSIATARVSMNTVDIGLPQLAMHSSYETAGREDTEDLIKVSKEFFSK